MIWQNPWAWLGLATLVLPVLIHLLGRGQTRRQRFPSLRFLPPSKSLPTRRRRVHDPLLLAVRLGILATVVSALAQPLFVTGERARRANGSLARAIILDTSASMGRGSSATETALVVARREAARIAAEAQTSVVIETGHPAQALQGAAAWANRQNSRAEIVIVSDFQTGAIDASDLTVVPKTIGVRLARTSTTPTVPEVISRAGAIETVARATASATTTDVEWTARTTAANSSRPNLIILAGARERGAADIAARAASAVSVRVAFDSTRAVAIVYPAFERRDEFVGRATELRSPWAADIIARLRADSMLIDAASGATPIANADSGAGLIVARSASGLPVVVAREGNLDGDNRLLILPLVDAGSLTSAALIAATTRALSNAPEVTELDPSTVPDGVLASWQREPAARAPASPDARTGSSDGRWFWVITLVLLAVETVLRRTRREPVVTHIAHDRAA